MPLLDHFRPPLSQRRHWDSFHGAWAESIAQHLNQLLPENFVAEARVKLGGQVEINVGTDLGLPIDLEMTYQAACSARRIAY